MDFYEGVRIIKGSIQKTLIGGDYVTQYIFKIIKNQNEVKEIVKRFSEIEDLHHVPWSVYRNYNAGCGTSKLLTKPLHYRRRSTTNHKATVNRN